jgi:mannosyl-3-phosphoglycerate phosphatase
VQQSGGRRIPVDFITYASCHQNSGRQSDNHVRATIDLLACRLIMPERPLYPLIFTDLDGTLLDHNSYSAKPADRLIQHISDRSIGSIIPVTSKTCAELRSLQQTIPIRETISVTENGSVIHMPHGYPFERASDPQTILLGIGYSEILDRIAALPRILRHHIRGFADMSAEEVSKATGLAMDEALLAKERQASEPFLWSGSDKALKELDLIMADADIRIQRGGRFYHFTGHATKQQAMAQIKAAFVERMTESAIISIALGDGPSDLGMIEAADIGVILPNPDGVTIKTNRSDVRTAPSPGPQGWVFSVRKIFAELGLILPES